MADDRFELLRRLAINDERAVSQVLSGEHEPPLIDEKTRALVRIAALLALHAAESSYQSAVERAHAAGVEDDEIRQLELSLVPIIGPVEATQSSPQTGEGRKPAPRLRPV